MFNRKERQSLGEREKLVENLYEDLKNNNDEPYTLSKLSKVLLADDDVMSNITLRGMIERSGKFHIISCYNGLEVYYKIKY